MPPRTIPPRLVRPKPSAWRGPSARVQRPPSVPPAPRKPCGLCNRVRGWLGWGPRQ